MVANAFANLTKTAEAPKKARKPTKVEKIIAGLEFRSTVKLLIDGLQGIFTLHDEGCKGQSVEYFIAAGRALGSQPANFTGLEGNAKASMQLRIRDNRTTLADEDIAVMAEAGMTEENGCVQKHELVPTCIRVNEAYEHDDALAKKLMVLLKKNGFPEDYLTIQQGKHRMIVGEKALDEVFRLQNEADTRRILPIISYPAIRGKLEIDNERAALRYAFDYVMEAMGVKDDDETEAAKHRSENGKQNAAASLIAAATKDAATKAAATNLKDMLTKSVADEEAKAADLKSRRKKS